MKVGRGGGSGEGWWKRGGVVEGRDQNGGRKRMAMEGGRDGGREGGIHGGRERGIHGGRERGIHCGMEGIKIQALALTRQLGRTEFAFHVISHDERVASSCTFKLHPQELVRHAMVNVNQLVKGMSVP